MSKKELVYTIQRLYHEGKALLEKYQIHNPDYKLSVSFTLSQEGDGHPKLTIYLRYDSDRVLSNTEPYFGFGFTPSIALNCFEEDLQKKSGKTLIERLGTEVPNA